MRNDIYMLFPSLYACQYLLVKPLQRPKTAFFTSLWAKQDTKLVVDHANALYEGVEGVGPINPSKVSQWQALGFSVR